MEHLERLLCLVALVNGRSSNYRIEIVPNIASGQRVCVSVACGDYCSIVAQEDDPLEALDKAAGMVLQELQLGDMVFEALKRRWQ